MCKQICCYQNVFYVVTSGAYINIYIYILFRHEYFIASCLKYIYCVLGVISWSSIIYLDVVKSRIQSDCLVNPRYKGTLDAFRQCYQEGGIRIFGRGFAAMALRAFPVNGATFLG